MTAPKKLDLPATLAVDFPCERRCQVEFDLGGLHPQFRLSQMLAVVERAHDEAHAAAPVRVFRYSGEVLVRADVLVGAS